MRMNKTNSILRAGALLPALLLCAPLACGGGDAKSEGDAKAEGEAGAESDAAADAEVLKAAEVAKKIKAKPADAEKILADAGMNAEQFEAQMYAIAEDPAKSEAFEKALN